MRVMMVRMGMIMLMLIVDLKAVVQNAAIHMLKLDGRMANAELVAQHALQLVKDHRAG
jgi:hypothetical protein